MGGIIRHSLLNFCPGFLINLVGMSVSALMKVHPICHVNFETTVSRFILYFLAQTFILRRKRTRQSEIFRLLSGWVKIHQIPYVMYGTTS